MSVVIEVEVRCTNPKCAERVYSTFPMKMLGTASGYIVDAVALHTYLINFNWQRIHGEWWCPKCSQEVKQKDEPKEPGTE